MELETKQAKTLDEVLSVLEEHGVTDFNVDINIGNDATIYTYPPDPDPGGDPDPDPNGGILSQPKQVVYFVDGAGGGNHLVPGTKTANSEDTSVERIFEKQPKGLIEGIPSPGYVGMPKSGTPMDRVNKVLNALNEWAFLVRQTVQKANGNEYEYPSEFPDFQGMWVKRDTLQTVDLDAWKAKVKAWLLQEMS